MPTDIALSPQEKAAVLMISLGVEYSSALYKNMSEEDITELTLSITMIKRIDKETRDTVIEEFYRLCRSQQYISDGGLDYARDILSQVFGTDAADKIINQLSSELAVKPFDFVRKVSADQILNVIHGEHPQTIALVLSFMKPKQAAEIVAALEPDLQADIIARIAGMGTTSPEFIREAEQVLERKVMSMGYGEQQSTGGVDEIVQIINSLDRASEKSILEQLAVKNPSLADEIRAKLFVFEDIAKLDSRSIQRVLKEVPNADLAAALKLATDEVRDKILGNMTKRLQAMIQDEIEVMGQMRIRDVEEAQQRVVAIVRRLEEEGEIDIARGDGDVFV